MKIIYNNIMPFPGFIALNIFGILFIRNEYKYLEQKLSYKRTLFNHESIHTKLIKELGYLGFYICYVVEWFYRYFFTKDKFSHNAYRQISFEKEAYDNENNLNYINNRPHYAMWKTK